MIRISRSGNGPDRVYMSAIQEGFSANQLKRMLG